VYDDYDDPELLCTDCSRVRAKANPRSEICDGCGTGFAWRPVRADTTVRAVNARSGQYDAAEGDLLLQTRFTWPRLLRLNEITTVAIPSVDQEAARDLLRAREHCRGGLMRARHRLSKLLLRHGIVYYDGDAWTGRHDTWLRHDAAPQLKARATRLSFDSDYENVLSVKARRDRLDVAIGETAAESEFTPLVQRLGCLRGVSTLTGFALAVEIGDWHRFTGNTIGSFVGLVPSELLGVLAGARVDHQDRQHPRPPTVGRSGLAPPRPLHGWEDHDSVH